jgi:hypothetical protein
MIKLKTLAENPNAIKGEYKYINLYIGDFFIMSAVPKQNLYNVATLDLMNLYINHSFIDGNDLYIELKAKIVED